MRTTYLMLAGILAAMGCSSEVNIGNNPLPDNTPQPRPLDGTANTDRIVQVTNPELDVLFLIDNSCSMANKQAKLIASFPKFMGFFLGSGLDYHIGAISTAMDGWGSPEQTNTQGRLRFPGSSAPPRYITPDTPNAISVFSGMANMGVGGSGDERGRGPIMMALDNHKDGWNEGFQRENASLHIIAISDEDDWTGHFNNAGPGGTPSRAEFIQFLQTLKTGNQDLTFNSIVNPPGVSLTFGEYAGIEYIAYTQAIGGILYDIREDDWADVLEQLGLQALGLKREFFLSQLPVPESIRVYVIEEGVQFDFGDDTWTYDPGRNSITFVDYLPQPLSEVIVEYDVLAAHQGG